MKVQVQVINAFSINGKGGNPAGVVFDADNISTQQKQAIATKAGFPETAFVSSSKLADFKLEFFTPTKQIAHCGHATIATFSYLKSMGKIPAGHSSKETIDGNRSILFKHGLAFMEQTEPVIQQLDDVKVVLDALHIQQHELMPGYMPAIVSTGNAFLIDPISNEKILAEINYDRKAVYAISEQYGLIGFYLFTRSSGFDATTRMFAPFYGIDEEAATGMAAGPLAVYLKEIIKRNQANFKIEQGRFMSPSAPSRIHVDLELEDNRIVRLFAGGDAHISKQLEVEMG